MTGEWPPLGTEIDHKDCCRDNDTWNNLRLATPAQNSANRGLRRDNTSGFKGVRSHYGKWRAEIMVNGKRKYLGSFTDPADAHAAYLAAAREAFGQCFNSSSEQLLAAA
jgi:hypothetical protein